MSVFYGNSKSRQLVKSCNITIQFLSSLEMSESVMLDSLFQLQHNVPKHLQQVLSLHLI